MEAKPLHSIPPCGYGKGDDGAQRCADNVAMEVKKGQKAKQEPKSPPSMRVDLGIDERGPPVIKNRKTSSVLTAAQFHELQLQAWIFGFMVAGLPVPPPLLLPILETFANFFGSVGGGIYTQYSNFARSTPPQGFNHRGMMDLEPGRCRRTDGKKWRCKKNVLPDQKYCERHMHRGCRRSRKHLAANSQTSIALDTVPPNNPYANTNSSKIPCITHETSEIIESGVTLGTGPVGGQKGISVPMTTNTSSGHKNTTSTMIASADDANTTTTYIALPTTEKCNSNIINVSSYVTDVGNRNCSNSVCCKSTVNIGNKKGYANNLGSKMIQGMDFSPKSVLQAPGCSDSCFYRSDLELEPFRCRRTDGKKWRCRRFVVTNQKYCEMHMHRGAKKQVKSSQPAAAFPTGSREMFPRAQLHPTVILPTEEACSNLNTNLSISIPASPQFITIDDKSTTSGSSDTTISDTFVAACRK